MHEGDAIKLGRIHFRIKEINLSKQSSTTTTSDIIQSEEAHEDLEDNKDKCYADRSSRSSQTQG